MLRRIRVPYVVVSDETKTKPCTKSSVRRALLPPQELEYFQVDMDFDDETDKAHAEAEMMGAAAEFMAQGYVDDRKAKQQRRKTELHRLKSFQVGCAVDNILVVLHGGGLLAYEDKRWAKSRQNNFRRAVAAR